MNNRYMAAFSAAFKTTLPMITGMIPTGIAYALLASSSGMRERDIILSSIIVFAGSVQFISIELIRQGMDYLQFALVVFLLHSRHLFYGISLFDKFNETGRVKPLMIYTLNDEIYALLTNEKSEPEGVNAGFYYIFMSAILYASWNIGTAAGAVASEFIRFNTEGMDFALLAMFTVVMLEQMKSFKSRLPFVIGGASAIVSLFAVGRSALLLGCAMISIISLLLLRKRIEFIETGGKQLG